MFFHSQAFPQPSHFQKKPKSFKKIQNFKIWLQNSQIGNPVDKIFNQCTRVRDDHYPVCRLDIRQDSQFATGYGYPKTAFKWEPDTDPDIRNTFIDVRGFTLLEKVAHCMINHSLSSEASFQPSVPRLKVCIWCNLCTVM